MAGGAADPANLLGALRAGKLVSSAVALQALLSATPRPVLDLRITAPSPPQHLAVSSP